MDKQELEMLAKGKSEWAEIDDVAAIARELLALRMKVEQQNKIIAAYNTNGFSDADAMAVAYLLLRESHAEMLHALRVMVSVFPVRSGVPSADMDVETSAHEVARAAIAKGEQR